MGVLMDGEAQIRDGVDRARSDFYIWAVVAAGAMQSHRPVHHESVVLVRGDQFEEI